MAARMSNFCHCQKFLLFEPTLCQLRLKTLRCMSGIELTTTAKSKEPIVIPKKKKRDELSVLRALASTVDKDGPHYKLFDDPYLIPTNKYEMKSCVLAFNSGRASAQYVMDNYSQFFENRPIEDFSFTPEAFKVYTIPKFDDDTIAGLEERIFMKKTVEAYQSFQKLKDKGDTVPQETVIDLFELLCFYNSKTPEIPYAFDENEILDDLAEQRQKKDVHEMGKEKWSAEGLAENLFIELETPNRRAYSALLRGRAKYNAAVNSTFTLHKEMKENSMKLTLEDYEALLTACDKLSEKKERIIEVLQEMYAEGISPSVNTFNIILRAISNSKDKQFSMQVINEMRMCGIEPTLASWSYILQIYYDLSTVYKKRQSGFYQGSESCILYELMDYLEGKEFTRQHPDDGKFFVTAMKCCASNLKDSELALKVDALLDVGRNRNFLKSSEILSFEYYNKFVGVLAAFENVDIVMERYYRHFIHSNDTIINHISASDIMYCLERNGAYQHFLPLWSEIKHNLHPNSRLIDSFLSMIAKCDDQPEIQQGFVQVTDEVLQMYEEKRDSPKPEYHSFSMTGANIDNLILICCNADEFEKAKVFFGIFVTEQKSIHGFLSFRSMESLLNLSITNTDKVTALKVCQVMFNLGHIVDKAIYQLRSNFDLSEAELNNLQSMTDEK